MRNIFIGWVLVPLVSLASAISFMELKVKSDQIIMVTYALVLLVPIAVIVRGTWTFSKAKGWSATPAIILAAIQVVIVLVSALFWLAALALMITPYK